MCRTLLYISISLYLCYNLPLKFHSIRMPCFESTCSVVFWVVRIGSGNPDLIRMARFLHITVRAQGVFFKPKLISPMCLSSPQPPPPTKSLLWVDSSTQGSRSPSSSFPSGLGGDSPKEILKFVHWRVLGDLPTEPPRIRVPPPS
jgi:hypothetical protein